MAKTYKLNPCDHPFGPFVLLCYVLYLFYFSCILWVGIYDRPCKVTLRSILFLANQAYSSTIVSFVVFHYCVINEASSLYPLSSRGRKKEETPELENCDADEISNHTRGGYLFWTQKTHYKSNKDNLTEKKHVKMVVCALLISRREISFQLKRPLEAKLNLLRIKQISFVETNSKHQLN